VTLVDVEHAAGLLIECRETGRAIPDLPDGLRPGTWDEAYAIQDALHANGAWGTAALKVGATSEVSQKALGTDCPFAGRLPATALFDSGATIDLSSVFHHPPRLESEFALHIGPGAATVDPDDLEAVRAVVNAVAPALELVGSRYDDMGKVSAMSLVADNAGSTAIVLGQPVATDQAGDLAAITVSLTSGGEELGAGSGADVMGDPVRSLQWALQHERARGRTPVPGTWVITGTCTGMVPYPLGQTVVARFSGLGEVSVTVTL
jgi:2-keto-4-pentenoate hydratase